MAQDTQSASCGGRAKEWAKASTKQPVQEETPALDNKGSSSDQLSWWKSNGKRLVNEKLGIQTPNSDAEEPAEERQYSAEAPHTNMDSRTAPAPSDAPSEHLMLVICDKLEWVLYKQCTLRGPTACWLMGRQPTADGGYRHRHRHQRFPRRLELTPSGRFDRSFLPPLGSRRAISIGSHAYSAGC
jgi:hypothetical protein